MSVALACQPHRGRWGHRRLPSRPCGVAFDDAVQVAARHGQPRCPPAWRPWLRTPVVLRPLWPDLGRCGGKPNIASGPGASHGCLGPPPTHQRGAARRL